MVAINRDWSTIPTNATTYSVFQGMLVETGFASSGASYGDPNPVNSVIRCFSTSAADVPTGSARYFFEKVFVVNNNTATALTGAQVEIASEAPTLPSGALLDAALTTALQRAPTPATRGSGHRPLWQADLARLSPSPPLPRVRRRRQPAVWCGAQRHRRARRAWLRLTLPAGTAAYKGSADLRTQGTTT